MQTTRLFNYMPDLPDIRDYKYKDKFKLHNKFEGIVDLRSYCSPVEDQGDLGSCTAQAIVGAVETLQNKNTNSYTDMSRLFLYYNERVIEGTVKSDSGAYIRDGIKTLADTGVCTEALWPYDISKFKQKPSDECYTEAANYKAYEYYRLLTIREMKSCLKDGRPFVFGFAVYESFVSDEVEKTGIVPIPSTKERLLGGHAVLAVGFNKEKQVFIVRNSWGTTWGDNGYFYMPFEYLRNSNLSSDFWTIVK